jgi:DNA-binding CsgD family transcriptional regulator
MSMSVGDDQLLSTIDTLYEAALQPDLWPTALDKIGDLVGQTSVLLTVFDHQEHALGKSFISRIDPQRLELFHREYSTPETNPHLGKNRVIPVGQPVFSHELCDHETFLRSGVYADCYRPEGLLHEVNVIVGRTKASITGVALMRQARSGSFGDTHLRLIQVLVPHLQRAVQALSHVEKLQAERQALSDAIDRVGFGVILLGANGRVVTANRVAREIARHLDGLLLSTGGIAASNPAEAERLHRLVAAATRRPFASGGVMALSRPSGGKPLSVLACPLSGHKLDSEGSSAAAVLFITDPERRIEALPDRLARLYGLTHREAGLAMLLMQGQDLREAGEQLGVSLSTVQTHLKRLFEKTGTHRQAEVVSLLLRTLAPTST